VSASPTLILGAGLSGLLAAVAFPEARVFESEHKPRAAHRALLRFRSPAVSQFVGIPFRQVRVRKGIWFDGAYRAPDIRLANWYAQKVTPATLADRSIWNLEPVDRWIAPEELYFMVMERVRARVTLGCAGTLADLKDGPVISTIPLPIMLGIAQVTEKVSFAHAPIHVNRYRLQRGTEVHQTVYFPDPDCAVYRASVTGELLTIESMGHAHYHTITPLEELDSVLNALGLWSAEPELVDTGTQQYGKIVPLPDPQRKSLLSRLTRNHNVFSLGRFATWRNILLDDVITDLARIRELIGMNEYERTLFTVTTRKEPQ